MAEDMARSWLQECPPGPAAFRKGLNACTTHVYPARDLTDADFLVPPEVSKEKAARGQAMG